MLAMHCLALSAVLMAAVPIVYKAGLIVTLFVSVAYRVYCWYTTPLYRLSYRENAWFAVTLGDDSETSRATELTLVDCYYWSRWLLVLRVENALGRRCYMPLAWDCCERDNFHRLRILSKYFLK